MDRMLGAIKKAAIEAVEDLKPVAIFYGVVTGILPLKINVNQRLPLTESSLILTKNVIDYKTKISFDNSSIKQLFTTWDVAETTESSVQKIAFKAPIKHDITVYNGLKVGDKVMLLRVQGGQKYVVWDKVIE